ncbi:MAG: alkaline phosphatase, partial [Georgenia sp.]
GDGTDTPAVRQGNRYSIFNSLTGAEPDQVLTLGERRDTVLVGDWDGNGTDTLAVRDGNRYSVWNTLTSGLPDQVIRFGHRNDKVLVGDWDGNGTDTLAVRQGNRYSVWNSFTAEEPDQVLTLRGAAGRHRGYYRDHRRDTVLVGDWDGNGSDTLAVRNGSRYSIWNALTSGSPDQVITFGHARDTVLVGDWDGK